MFGGAVPLKGTGGKTIGYYDHQAGATGLKITSIYAGIAPFFQPGGWMDGLLEGSSPRVASAIAEGIEEALHGHHPHPLYMGGDANQERELLRASLHRMLHSKLGGALRELGFPPVGGITGSRTHWQQYFDLNPGSREQALQVLRQISKEFDQRYGTSIIPKLDKTLGNFPKKP
jgi:hypothetical protein